MERSLLFDLPTFLAVARHSTMTKAAESLHTVQSNVTSRIRRLEEELGTTLFVRGPRRLVLTSEGEALMGYALRLEELNGELRQRFRPEVTPQTGELRVGAIETFAASRLIRWIEAFSRVHPNVDLSVEAGGTDVLRRRVTQSELDVAFVSRPSQDPNLVEEKVLEDELVVLAPKGTTSLAALDQAGSGRLRVLVQRAGCSFTARLMQHLRESGVHPRPAHSVGTLEGMIERVRAGAGVAVLPRSYLESVSRQKGLVLLPLPDEYRTIAIYMVVQRWRLPIRLLEAFAKSCREQGEC